LISGVPKTDEKMTVMEPPLEMKETVIDSIPKDIESTQDTLSVSKSNESLSQNGSMPDTLSKKPLDANVEKIIFKKPENDSGLQTPTGYVAQLHQVPYDDLYKQGIKHYLDNEWSLCASYFQLAIDDYKWHQSNLLQCRKSCKNESDSSELMGDHLDASEIFFERMIRNALCLIKCRRDKFTARKDHVVEIKIVKEFELRKPYDYLQLCLFKIGRYSEAADAAVTVLAAQPKHSIMTQNLQQYIKDYNVDASIMTNQEQQDYAREYILGDSYHQEEDHSFVVWHMEAALSGYWTALRDCRTMCDEPFDQGWLPDFVSSIANHFTFTLRCKRRCPSKLANLYGEEITDFLPSMFNYLQYSYHHMGNAEMACGAVESCLELLPTNADMIRNKQFYETEYKNASSMFVVRPEVSQYVATERYEKNLMHFIDTEFLLLDDKEWKEPKPDAETAEVFRQYMSSFVGKKKEL